MINPGLISVINNTLHSAYRLNPNSSNYDSSNLNKHSFIRSYESEYYKNIAKKLEREKELEKEYEKQMQKETEMEAKIFLYIALIGFIAVIACFILSIIYHK